MGKEKIDLPRLIELLRGRGIHNIHVMHNKVHGGPDFFISYENQAGNLFAAIVQEDITFEELIDALNRELIEFGEGYSYS